MNNLFYSTQANDKFKIISVEEDIKSKVELRMAASAAQVLCTGLFAYSALKAKKNSVKLVSLGLGALSIAALGIYKFLRRDVIKQKCQIMHFGRQVNLIPEN